MSCLPIPPPTRSKKPEFEPVTPTSTSGIVPHVQTYAHRGLGVNGGAATNIASTNSSPKLRLDFSSGDGEAGCLMSEADFEDILGVQKNALDLGQQELDERMARLGLKKSGICDKKGLNVGIDASSICSNQCLTSGENEDLKDERTDVETGDENERVVAVSRPRPRPLSIVPRSGTLTALPGSRMADADDQFPSSSKDITWPASKLVSMPPPQFPTSTPTRSTNPCTPLSTPTMPSNPGRRLHHSWKIDQSRKRKLSLSAPFLDNVKRIFTSNDAKPQITHLTHEATAVNRSASVPATKATEGGNVSQKIENKSRSTSVATTPVTIKPEVDAISPAPTNETSPSMNTNQTRNLITPIFAGPSSVYSNENANTNTNDPVAPSTPTTTTKNPIPRLLSTVQNRLAHRRTDTNTSTVTNESVTTSKASLNRLIVKLRSQITDLTLENQVLKDQIAIVRKDWIDTAQELDLERHRCWEGEMMRFRLGVNVEELRSEIGRLRRGSVID